MSSSTSETNNEVQPVAMLSLSAHFLRQVYNTAVTYVHHASQGRDEIVCNDIVRAMRRELIDTDNGAISVIKSILVDERSVPDQVKNVLNENCEGAQHLVDCGVAEDVVHNAISRCMTSGCSLTNALLEIQEDDAQRVVEKETQQKEMQNDPVAQHIISSLQTKTESERAQQRAVMEQMLAGIAAEGELQEGQEEDSAGDDVERNPLVQEEDEDYAVERDGKCDCDVCAAVAHAQRVFSLWQPQDAVDQHLFDLGSTLVMRLFDDAEELIEEEQEEEEEEEEDDSNQNDDDDDGDGMVAEDEDDVE